MCTQREIAHGFRVRDSPIVVETVTAKIYAGIALLQYAVDSAVEVAKSVVEAQEVGCATLRQ